jgi:hypothetical protein
VIWAVFDRCCACCSSTLASSDFRLLVVDAISERYPTPLDEQDEVMEGVVEPSAWKSWKSEQQTN